MNSVLLALSPGPIQKSEFENIVKDILNQIDSDFNDEKIRYLLNDYGDKPYYFKKNGIYLENKRCTPTIRDAARFYVLIKYLTSYKSYNDSGGLSKTSLSGTFDAKKYYREFFGDKWDETKEFIYNLVCGEPGEDSNLFADVKIDIVSGSVYKIKKYFLENSRIKDIRGGSALIKYINEDVTFDYLKNEYIEECAIYCGGGNVLIIAPENEGSKICSDLEKKCTEISLTTQNAFVYIQANLNELIKQYKTIMSKINRELDERKKIKVYKINPDNDLGSIMMGKEKIKFNDAEKVNENEAKICYLCAVRDGKYRIHIPDVEAAVVCPSCLRKHKVGEKKAIFYDEYKEFTGSAIKKNIDSIVELEDKNGHIAVIYADGNNMGNVVKNIETPFQHMYFSRTLDRTTKKCVYESIHKVMGNEAMFEAIALGGDDIFIIVPGDKSLEITNNIINEFDRAFENKMTMSAGVCIAKSNTPIRTMFEVAQYMLKSAKKHSRKTNNSEGTVDIQFIQSNIGIDLLKSESSLFPANNSEFSSYLEIIKSLKQDKEISISQLYKLSNAWHIMKNPMEFQLFYLYQASRISHKYANYASRLLSNKKNIKENDYCYCGLIQKKSDTGSAENADYISLWDDIILLWDAVGGE